MVLSPKVMIGGYTKPLLHFWLADGHTLVASRRCDDEIHINVGKPMEFFDAC